MLENVRFNAGETSKDDAERGAFADRARGARRRVRLRRLRRGAPQAGLACTTSRSGCRTRMGGLVRDRARRAEAAHRGPRAALRRRARRLEGLRQARRHRQPARQGRQAADRRRHGLHLPQGPGPRGRQEPARGGPARHLPRPTSSGPRSRASRSCCRPTSWSTPTFPSGDREPHPRVVPADADPGRRARPRHRSRSPARPSPPRSPTPGRSSGTARWASSRSTPFAEGTRAVAAGAHRGRRPVRRRRWRLRRRRTRSSASTRRPSATSPPAAAPASSTSRARSSPASRSWRTDAWRRSAVPADGGQLEDEPQPPGSGGAGPEAGLDAGGQEARLRQGRGGRRARRSPTCARVQTLVDGDRLSIAYGAQDVSTHDVRRLHRRDLGRRCWPSSGCTLRRGRPLRAPRVPRRDRRGRQRQGAQGARGRA